MLVLTRKVGEGIAIGDDVKIVVMQIKGKQVRLGIRASSNTVVHREEIYQRIQDENRRAFESGDEAAVDQASEMIGNKPQPASPPLRRYARPPRSSGDNE